MVDQKPNSGTLTQEEAIAAIFGSGNDPWGAPDDEDTFQEQVPPTTEPATPPQSVQPQEQPAQPVDNDQVRYAYWQSEAMKKEAELARIREENERFKAQLTQPPEQEEEFVFPDPPQKPKVPYGYSPEQAMSDPQSESYKFAMDYQKWQDDIQEYNDLKVRYLEETFNEKLAKFEQRDREAAMQRDQEMKWNQYVSGVRENVMKDFGVDQPTADKFIQFASSPDSLTVENMFRMFAVANGIQQAPPPAKAPTASFNQATVAAGFAPPPSMLTSGQPSNPNGEVDAIFDTIVAREKQRNDW